MSTEEQDFKSLVGIVNGIYAEHEAELRLGLERYHSHSCRKTLATLIIKRSPNSLELIQKHLNHHTPTMTLRYLMEIPSISTTVKQHILEVNRKRIVNVLVATGIRHCERAPLQELPDR